MKICINLQCCVKICKLFVIGCFEYRLEIIREILNIYSLINTKMLSVMIISSFWFWNSYFIFAFYFYRLWANFYTNTTLISFVGHIKLLRMVMSFSLRDSWLHFSVHQIIVVSVFDLNCWFLQFFKFYRVWFLTRLILCKHIHTG